MPSAKLVWLTENCVNVTQLSLPPRVHFHPAQLERIVYTMTHLQKLDVYRVNISNHYWKLVQTVYIQTVYIQVGDTANMPYDHASFDVTLSFYTTCNLSPEAYKNHFHGLN